MSNVFATKDIVIKSFNLTYGLSILTKLMYLMNFEATLRDSV